MTAIAILAMCADRGVTLTLEGEGIRVRGPSPARGELLPDIRAHKPELLQILKSPAQPGTRTPLGDNGSYVHVASVESLRTIAQAVEKANEVALDLETTGLDAILHHPRLLQLALPDGSVYVIDLWAVRDISVLIKAMAKITVVAHNAQFDLA